MNQTLIQNKGITETIINDNNQLHINTTNWDSNYDGNTANILLDTSTNGKHTVYTIQLDNQDLANLLNIDSDDITLDKRLIKDFKKHNKIKNRTQTPYIIEFDKHNDLTPAHTHLSSPLPNENLIITSPYNNNNTLSSLSNSHRKKSSNKFKFKKRHSNRNKSYRKSNKTHTQSNKKTHKSYIINRRTRRTF